MKHVIWTSLYKEVNRTDPSPSVKIPWHSQSLAMVNREIANRKRYIRKNDIEPLLYVKYFFLQTSKPIILNLSKS